MASANALKPSRSTGSSTAPSAVSRTRRVSRWKRRSPKVCSRLRDPRPGPRQVRVAVHATSINPLDCQIRRGDYADQVELPAIIGHDVSGVVDQIGSDVTEFSVGDEVY